jgi:hypothetical protein
MPMATQPGVQMRFARPDDLEEIGRLLPSVAGPLFPERFPGETVAGFCRWKYFTNPVGEAVVAIAVSAGQVVSVVAAVPKRVRVGSETLLAFELGDFITAENYRKRGLFSSLIQMVCDEAGQRGAVFVYVRPNSISFRILSRELSFLEVRKIDERRYVVPSGLIHRKTGIAPALVRGLGADWAAGRILMPSAERPITVSQTTRFGADMDELWEIASRRYSLALVRDRQYLNWRYADSPTPYLLWVARRDGQTAGYAIGLLSRSQPIGYLVDLFTDPEDKDASAALLRTGMQSMLAAGAQSLLTWTLQSGADSAGARFLRRACPIVAKPHLHLAMRFLDPGCDLSRLPLDGWQIAAGDFDGT